MAATVNVYWPGITEEQIDSQPPFYDGGHAWAEWRAALDDETTIAQDLIRLGVGALLTAITSSMRDDEVAWVTPDKLREAAGILHQAIVAADSDVLPVIALYGRVMSGEADAAEEFLATLEELEDIASFAETMGVEQMTLEIDY